MIRSRMNVIFIQYLISFQQKFHILSSYTDKSGLYIMIYSLFRIVFLNCFFGEIFLEN